MIRIRYLTLLMLLLGGSIGTWAQSDDFNPDSPAEPGPPGGNMPMLTVVADPVEGGTANGGGWYSVGSKVTVRAYNKTNYVFDCWTNEQGETVSTESQFKYEKQTGDEILTAHFRFSPGSPAEPTEIAQQIYYKLTVMAEEGGSASGGGKYLPNTRVYVSASVNTGYTFDGWYNSEGQKVATTMGYYYTTTTANETLTARFLFTPSNPDEPVTPVISKTYKVTATAEEGGTVNMTSTTLAEGKTVTLTATANTGYVFDGWYVDGVLYTKSRSFTYTMGTANIAFVAHFVFNPSSPGEPTKPTTHKYAFYLMNYVTIPGETVDFPICLTSLDELKDISFQITFDPALSPDLTSIKMSEKAVGYEVVYESIEENTFVFTLTGGKLPDGNMTLMVLSVPIPEDIPTAKGYPIKINQVAVTETDGTEVTASTRNGRISVYKLGDVNGDDKISIADVTQEVNIILGRNKEYEPVIADVNQDEHISISDVTRLVNVILGK